ncbi:Flagellar biosynthetic protein FlhB [Chlamydiales bacterium STE3]|nr:Flagellar biosynthetic protein FlhB [Chlamydiales bacterium STE3]
MGEKTEKATPKKLRDARKKGQVAKSQDLPAAFTFIVSIWVILGLSTTLYHYLGDFIVTVFKKIPEGNIGITIGALFYESFRIIFLASMPALLIVSAIGVIVNFLAVGPVFSTEVFKFDIKKFNPVENLKAKFKLKTLVELVKSLLKVFVAAYLIYGVMYSSIPVLITAVSMPMASALLIFYKFLLEVVIKVGLFFLVVAVLDFAYQKMSFSKEMMMEKFEVKQEYKNTEGDPQIKGKRRQIAQEMAYEQGPAGGLKKASAVVTNPTHLAIAIGYAKGIDAAPYILAMGQDALAERMIKMADEFGIPVVRNIKLAHKLWDQGELYEFIPEDSYEAVAEILRWIASLQSDEPYDYSEKNDE